MATLIPPAAAPPAAGTKPAEIEPKIVDYMDLPCPIPYEEIHREALMSPKPELFEGMRFDFTKGLNQRFSLSHRLQGMQVLLKIVCGHCKKKGNHNKTSCSQPI